MSVQCCFTQALRNEAQAEWTVVYGAVLPPPARNTHPLFLIIWIITSAWHAHRGGKVMNTNKKTQKIRRQNKTTITSKINSKGLRVRFCNIQYTLLCKLSGAKRARRKEWIRSSFSITLNLEAAGKSPSGGKIKSSYSTTDTVA